MTQQSALIAFLHRRKQRAIAVTMGVVEREVFPNISPAVQQKLRKVILDQMNDIYDAAVDLLGSVDNESVQLNELYLTKLTEIHESLVMNGKSVRNGDGS